MRRPELVGTTAETEQRLRSENPGMRLATELIARRRVTSFGYRPTATSLEGAEPW